MSNPAFSLFTTRRFAPLFITHFLGTMNDNVFKNALIILTLFRLATGDDAQILVTIAAGVFVLPFFLFSATAGQLADKYEKSFLIRRIKLAEIVIMAFGTAAFYLGDTNLLLGVLFLTGAQSTFFGPLKYGILPEHLNEHELIGGNALIEAGTFIAILLGTIVGGIFILGEHGLTIVAAIVLGLSVVGWIASHTIPKAPSTAIGIQVNPNFVAETWRIIIHTKAKRQLFVPILGISWYWLMGATFLTQFPNLTKVVLGGNEEVVTLLLTSFAIGIGIGSLLCTALLRGEVSARFVPYAAVAVTVFIVDLFFAIADRNAGTVLIDAATFVARPENWRVLFDVVGIATACGLYSVPLYATLQNESAPEHRARNAAANNVVNSLFMVVGVLWAAAMLASAVSVPVVLLSIAIGNAAVAITIRGQLARHLTRSILARAPVLSGDQFGERGGNGRKNNRGILILIGLIIAITLAMLFVDPIPQDPGYHRFSDTRSWLGIPNFGDVISNLTFMIAGGLGLWGVTGARGNVLFMIPSDGLPYRVFFAAVLLIGLGSSYYHLAPDTERLVWDRLPMTVAFMAFFASFVADRIDRSVGLIWILPVGIILGIASLAYWSWSESLGRGDLRPYALIQFAPVLLLPVLCLLYPARRYTDGLYLAAILSIYLLAKLFEQLDAEVFAFTAHTVGGHAVKHVIAAVACYLPLLMLRQTSAASRIEESLPGRR